MIWLLVFETVIWGGVTLWHILPAVEWAKTLVLVLYTGLVWTVVTKL